MLPFNAAFLQEGYPILLEFTGRTDLANVFASLGEENFLRYVAWYHERQEAFMRACRAADGTARHKMTVVVDLSGISMGHATSAVYGALKKRVRLEEDNYPEVVRTVSIVNAPAVFTAIWAVVSKFLDDGTRAKMSIHGTSFHKDVEGKGVNVKSLPAELGGDLVNHGIHLPTGPIPPHYLRGFGSEGDTVELKAGSTVELAVPLAAGEVLSWEFFCEDGRDVEFSAYSLGSDEAVAVGVLDKALQQPEGDSQTGYAVVRPACCQNDDGTTNTVALGKGSEVPFSGASELHGQQACRAKGFKNVPAPEWATIQSPGKVTHATNTFPLDAKLPSVRYDCNSTRALPRLGGFWKATPAAPVQPSLEAPTEGGGAGASDPPAAAAAGATEAQPGAATGESHFKRGQAPLSRVVVLRWSNAYSWMKSKTVARRILVWSADGAARAVEMQAAWCTAHDASAGKRVPGAAAAGAAAEGASAEK